MAHADACKRSCFNARCLKIVQTIYVLACNGHIVAGNSAYEKLFEKKSYKENDYIVISYHASQAGNRRGPMVPKDFDVLLDTLTFTSGADLRLTLAARSCVTQQAHERAHINREQSLTWWHGSPGTAGADKEVVRPKYSDCFNALVTGATSMSLRGYDMSTDSAEEVPQSGRQQRRGE
eukprot:4286644-Amphidinium_carterae.1